MLRDITGPMIRKRTEEITTTTKRTLTRKIRRSGPRTELRPEPEPVRFDSRRSTSRDDSRRQQKIDDSRRATTAEDIRVETRPDLSSTRGNKDGSRNASLAFNGGGDVSAWERISAGAGAHLVLSVFSIFKIKRR